MHLKILCKQAHNNAKETFSVTWMNVVAFVLVFMPNCMPVVLA